MDLVLQRGSGLLQDRCVVRLLSEATIKAMTKSRRSKNIPQIVGRVIARREVPLQVFLALGDKKAHLARSLSDERIAQAAGDTTIVVSGGCSN